MATRFVFVFTTLFCLASVFGFGATSDARGIEEINGRVVSIADGDTLTVLDAANRQHKIRLDGIDAPEKSQPYANVSKDRLSYLINQFAGGNVLVRVKTTDKYGRKVGRVYAVVDVNELLLREGLAYHYRQYDDDMGGAFNAFFSRGGKICARKPARRVEASRRRAPTVGVSTR